MPRKAIEKVDRPEEGQKKRIPLHESRNVLSAHGIDIPGHITRMVNDKMPNDLYRIQRFLDAGWRFVHKNEANGEVTLGDRTVNSAESADSLVSRPVGQGVVAYLMAISKDLYDEDFVAKQRKVDEIDHAMKAAGKQEGRYGSVTIE